VQFEIDANGILKVLARDTKTGLERIVSLSSAINVDEDQVHEMVEQSVEHAFEDMDARKWIEAAAKAKEAVNAARLGLDSFAGEIDYSDAIMAAIQEVERILEASDKTAGDLPGLKSAVSGLDKVTMPMAELMMEQAMEMILKRQGAID
jgi:molecular chaperone DnaK (HSP70)